MRCPYCGYLESKVLDSRAAEEGSSIRRRRECLRCTRRFTTYEVIEEIPIMVVKKDGRREMFDRSKLMNGVLRACEKRPISLAKVEELVEKVERDIRNNMEREVSTQRIGEMAMEHLRDIDQVAYVRFASVYRQFTDLSSFLLELEALMKLQAARTKS